VRAQVVRTAARRQDNPNFIKMYHGHLEINVPRRIFRDGTAETDPEEVERFRRTLASRYPWLSRHALDDVVKGAQEAMADHIERSRTAPERARVLLSRDRPSAALKIIEEHLIDNPEDAEAWYVAAEALCKMGRPEEGFRAMGRARSLSRTTGIKH
jgi:hypothetical protein